MFAADRCREADDSHSSNDTSSFVARVTTVDVLTRKLLPLDADYPARTRRYFKLVERGSL